MCLLINNILLLCMNDSHVSISDVCFCVCECECRFINEALIHALAFALIRFFLHIYLKMQREGHFLFFYYFEKIKC